MSAFWGRAYPSSEESVMDNINDIIAAIEEPPETFEEYLTRYAAQVGTLVNSYIPQGSHPDMDRYLYEPLNAYSQNGGDPLLDDATKVRVVNELIEMTRRTIEGQALDIGWARDGRYDITPEDYLVMATHKTAHYSGAVPLAIGAIIGGGTEAEIEALRNYGLDTGLAFQIQDDLLNLVGSEESTKKDFRNDITEGKRTLMVVHALQHSDDRDRLIDILSSKEKDQAVLAEAVDIMETSGSIEYARNYAENLTSIAKNRLVDMVRPSSSRELLISMADWFVNRLK